MTFIWPWMLISLGLVPLLAAGYFRLSKVHQGSAQELGPLGIARDRAGRTSGRRRHLPAMLFMLGLALLLLTLARPEMPVELPRISGTVILGFDVSSSMAADDLTPTRMDAAKNAARIFVENQPSTVQIGVVAFSNGGLVVQPPTDDQAVVLAAIDRLTPQGATSLGQGIYSSLNAIAGEAISIDPESLSGEARQIDIGQFPGSVILLLTDGENTASPDPVAVAQLAADAGVRIYPVGIGSPDGAVIELEGYQVQTQLNEPLLQEIASLTNGNYYQAADQETLEEIYNTVDLQLTIEGEKMEVTSLFAGAGLLVFVLGGLLSLLWFGRMPI